MCLYKFGARNSGLNNWERRGEGMYCTRALLEIPRSGTSFFLLRTPLLLALRASCIVTNMMRRFFLSAVHPEGLWATPVLKQNFKPHFY